MRQTFAGTLRILCAAFLTSLFTPGSILGADLRWEGLPDRERVIITMEFTEGMAGPVGRIDLHGVLLPFTQVPPGLEMRTAPPEAKIFLGTRQLGRSVVLMTKTPEFGFMVASQTPTELVVDFFPNTLGARWKPPNPSPVTEIPPDVGLRPMDPDNAADAALTADPAGAANPVSSRVAEELSTALPAAPNSAAASLPAFAAAPAPTSVQSAAPAPNSAAGSSPFAPSVVPSPASASAAVSVPGSTPASVSAPSSAPASAPASVSAPSSAPASAAVPSPAPIQNPAAQVIRVQTSPRQAGSAPAVSAQASAPTAVPAPASAPASASAAVSASVQPAVSAPASAPDPAAQVIRVQTSPRQAGSAAAVSTPTAVPAPAS
ncbi:MAG: hypothetical protein LBJ82_00080, partial [Deltaproteobacteria bacterium]|nr:hypothetical protein [Deltaproteobacteria bacterium]